MPQKDICKGCTASVRHSFDEVNSKMNEFINTIPEENRVSDQIYRVRLDHCANCSGLYYESTCRYCGCFVQMRAMRKNMHCPYPGVGKW